MISLYIHLTRSQRGLHQLPKLVTFALQRCHSQTQRRQYSNQPYAYKTKSHLSIPIANSDPSPLEPSFSQTNTDPSVLFKRISTPSEDRYSKLLRQFGLVENNNPKPFSEQRVGEAQRSFYYSLLCCCCFHILHILTDTEDCPYPANFILSEVYGIPFDYWIYNPFRLLTSTFMHAEFGHLTSNLILSVVSGHSLNRIFGSRLRYWTFWLFASVATDMACRWNVWRLGKQWAIRFDSPPESEKDCMSVQGMSGVTFGFMGLFASSCRINLWSRAVQILFSGCMMHECIGIYLCERKQKEISEMGRSPAGQQCSAVAHVTGGIAGMVYGRKLRFFSVNERCYANHVLLGSVDLRIKSNVEFHCKLIDLKFYVS